MIGLVCRSRMHLAVLVVGQSNSTPSGIAPTIIAESYLHVQGSAMHAVEKTPIFLHRP